MYSSSRRCSTLAVVKPWRPGGRAVNAVARSSQRFCHVKRHFHTPLKRVRKRVPHVLAILRLTCFVAREGFLLQSLTFFFFLLYIPSIMSSNSSGKITFGELLDGASGRAQESAGASGATLAASVAGAAVAFGVQFLIFFLLKDRLKRILYVWHRLKCLIADGIQSTANIPSTRERKNATASDRMVRLDYTSLQDPQLRVHTQVRLGRLFLCPIPTSTLKDLLRPRHRHFASSHSSKRSRRPWRSTSPERDAAFKCDRS